MRISASKQRRYLGWKFNGSAVLATIAEWPAWGATGSRADDGVPMTRILIISILLVMIVRIANQRCGQPTAFIKCSWWNRKYSMIRAGRCREASLGLWDTCKCFPNCNMLLLTVWFAQVIEDNSNLGGSTILEMTSPMIEKISPLAFCIGSKAGSMVTYNAS